jgi:alpha-NAC-related protein
VFPKINQRQMAQAMRQMGISQDEIAAEEVIIRCREENIIISSPSVVKMKMNGEENFQISGKISYEKVSSETEINEDDISTVIEQTAVSREEAASALKSAKGDIAAAILSLKKE